MSLHTLAHHLQSAGRGEDKVLVHMTPKEVQGLQALAMSHGGSLTINPETGLPEAGILSAILPMVAGFFLGPAGLGLTAMQSALTVGALGTAATGSLGKGFMMGLGAYGGAGLGEGLSAVGAANAPSVQIPPVGADAAGAQSMADIYGKMGPGSYSGGFTGAEIQNAGINATNLASPVSSTGGFNALNLSQAPTGQFADAVGSNVAHMYAPQTPVDVSGITSQVKPVPVAEMSFAPGMGPAPTNMSLAPPPAAPYTAVKPPMVDASAYNPNAYDVSSVRMPTEMKVPTAMDNITAGAKRGLGSWEGAKEVWNATAPGTGYGLAATGMGVLQAQQEEAAAEAKAKADALAAARRGNVRPYEFSTSLNENAFAPRESTSEFAYYTEPRFIAKPIEKIAKEGGLMSLAVGGPVEDMSAENAIGRNMMYPQSQLHPAIYSNPMVQRPMPNDVISQGIDTNVDRYSGEEKFASGGTAAAASAPTTDTKYTYDPATMQYTETTTTTPATKTSNNFLPIMGGIPSSGTMPVIFQGTPFTPLDDRMRAGPIGNIMSGIYGAYNQGMSKLLQPTTTTQTMGGTTTPYSPTGLAAADTSMVPNIQIPQQQNINQQLGLEAFYPMMEQQLAAKGSQLQARGYAEGGTANGGYSLGSYSDGGRLLRGPGDGVSDSIPASIGDRQPARLADGEFVVPARIVSEIGNGSTEAGARKLYAMMDRVQNARKKTVGKSKVAVNTKADKLLPA